MNMISILDELIGRMGKSWSLTWVLAPSAKSLMNFCCKKKNCSCFRWPKNGVKVCAGGPGSWYMAGKVLARCWKSLMSVLKITLIIKMPTCRGPVENSNCMVLRPGVLMSCMLSLALVYRIVLLLFYGFFSFSRSVFLGYHDYDVRSILFYAEWILLPINNFIVIRWHVVE